MNPRLILVGKVGANPYTRPNVTAALIASIAINHFGGFGVETHRAHPMRLLGAASVVGEVALISKF